MKPIPVAKIIEGTETDADGNLLCKREIDWYAADIEHLPDGTPLYTIPEEKLGHIAPYESGEHTLTVTDEGQFIWADNADELIERAIGATRHILIALREVRK